MFVDPVSILENDEEEEKLQAELARVRAELAELKAAAREVCDAAVDHAGKTEALRRLGNVINYTGWYSLIW